MIKAPEFLSETLLDNVTGGLEGGAGFDFVQVNGSNTAGDSFLAGGTSSSRGGAGNDILIGGRGNDVIL